MRTFRTLVAASGSVVLPSLAVLAVSAIAGCAVHTQAAVEVHAPPPPHVEVVATVAEPAPAPATAAVVVAPAPPPAEPVVVAASTGPAPAPAVVVEASDDEDYTPAVLPTFQQELDAHGWWVEDQCGTVWVPRHDIVGASFYPYMSHGHWAYTAEGYSWASDFPWGNRTFHYGRWYWSKTWGWVWSPSGRYTTAAVEWRFGGGHMGWRPLPPDRCWRGGRAVPVTTDWEGPGFTFVPGGSFFSPSLGSVVITGERSTAFMGSTTVYVAPPRATGSAVVFYGPAPTAAAIPAAHITAATVVVPPASRTIHWAPPMGHPPVLHPAPPPPAKPIGFAPSPGPRIVHPPMIPGGGHDHPHEGPIVPGHDHPHEGEPARPHDTEAVRKPGTHPGEPDPHKGPAPHEHEVESARKPEPTKTEPKMEPKMEPKTEPHKPVAPPMHETESVRKPEPTPSTKPTTSAPVLPPKTETPTKGAPPAPTKKPVPVKTQ
jgi:hypothetical protein